MNFVGMLFGCILISACLTLIISGTKKEGARYYRPADPIGAVFFYLFHTLIIYPFYVFSFSTGKFILRILSAGNYVPIEHNSLDNHITVFTGIFTLVFSICSICFYL